MVVKKLRNTSGEKYIFGKIYCCLFVKEFSPVILHMKLSLLLRVRLCMQNNCTECCHLHGSGVAKFRENVKSNRQGYLGLGLETTNLF